MAIKIILKKKIYKLMFGNDKTKEKKYCYLIENKSSFCELKSFQL